LARQRRKETDIAHRRIAHLTCEILAPLKPPLRAFAVNIACVADAPAIQLDAVADLPLLLRDSV